MAGSTEGSGGGGERESKGDASPRRQRLGQGRSLTDGFFASSEAEAELAPSASEGTELWAAARGLATQ